MDWRRLLTANPGRCFIRFKLLLTVITILAQVLLPDVPLAVAKDGNTVKVSILIYGDNRKDTLDGFMTGMAELGKQWHNNFVYDIKSAEGERERLPELAREIIASLPDIAVAGGGIEADALKEASAGTSVPVVFLAVTAAVDRGLAADILKPGGNLTGMETNDALLTAKRFWYLTKILPTARKITVFHVPAIGASVESVKVAREAAIDLGLELTVLEGADKEELIKAAAFINPVNTDVIQLTPVAPLDQILETHLLQLSLEHKIPIMGYNYDTLLKGAITSYGGSRYEMGRQSVNLVHKILMGESPSEIPIQTPQKIQLIMNRWMINRLGLKSPDSAWSMADRIEHISF